MMLRRGNPLFYVCTAAAILSVSTYVGADPTAAEVDNLLRRQIESRKIPAASVAVVRLGEVVYSTALGLANVELSVPAADHTVYELASLTKQFTGFAVMLLVERGALSLDDNVVDVVDGLPAAWDTISIRHLLHHTSGIKSVTSLPGFFDTAQLDHTQRELIGLVGDLPLEFPPGDRMQYNNTGYFLLGMVIEAVSDTSYDQFLQHNLFAPLGMADTRINDRDLVISHRADGYVWTDSLRNARMVSPALPYAAGGLVTTLGDLANWERALHERQLLTSASYDTMWSAGVLNDGTLTDYGFGWRIDTDRGLRRQHHSGGIPGFSTYGVRYLDSGLAVYVLTNLDNADTRAIALGVAELYLPELAAEVLPAVPDPSPETTAFLRKVIVAAAQGEGLPEWFEQRWRVSFLPDRVRQGKRMLGMYGDLTRFVLVSESHRDGLDVREYHARFGMVDFRITFKVTSEGQVAGISVQRT